MCVHVLCSVCYCPCKWGGGGGYAPGLHIIYSSASWNNKSSLSGLYIHSYNI